MITTRRARLAVAVALVAIIAVATTLVVRTSGQSGRIHMVAYFLNSNGIFVGDDVRIRGVDVGKIDNIEPQATRVKISFWVENTYQVPADAKAVILSPTLVTARAIQLTPPYHSGAVLADNAVIPQDRTAVPAEWDDFRDELEKLTETLQPTQPGGVSTLGEFINTAADNLRGQGPAIRDAIIKLSQAVSALSDHSADTFSTVKNLSILVSALQDSTVLLRELNQNLASVTGVLTDDPGEVARAIKDLSEVTGEVKTFVGENRDALGTTSDKLASVSQALTDSLDDIKQLLHVAPTTLSNFNAIYQPAQATMTGALAANNFSDPITFLCGAIQAASRSGAEQSAKLCVQYLAPIVKNRQYNFLPLGLNPFVGASTRPNEVTYSEDWMRPDYVPPQPLPADDGSLSSAQNPPAPLTAEAPLPTDQRSPAGTPAQPPDPAAGLPGMMLPPQEGTR